MNCPRCSTNNRAEAVFCVECGLALPKPQLAMHEKPTFQQGPQPSQMDCPRCGLNNRAEAGLCEECGMTLRVPQTATLGEPVYQQQGTPPPQMMPPRATYNRNNMSYPLPSQYPGYSYQTNRAAPKGNASTDWAAITGLVIGILSLPSCLGGFGVAVNATSRDGMIVAMASGICLFIAILGIAFSSVGITSTKKGMAIAGLICSIVSAVFALIFLFVAVLTL